MESFIIEGGHPLSGTITPQGAKNEALEVICATLLTTEPVAISNIPDILDVNNLIRLLTDIGVKVQRTQPGTLVFQADDLNLAYLQSTEFVKKCSSLRGRPAVGSLPSSHYCQAGWRQDRPPSSRHPLPGFQVSWCAVCPSSRQRPCL